MELDLQRFYNLNRRVLMWIVFFAILYLLRQFFAVMFLTFIFGFLMRKVARFLTARTRIPYRLAVVGPYLVALSLLILLIAIAVPRIVTEGANFADNLEGHFKTLAVEIEGAAKKHGMDDTLKRFIESPESVATNTAATASKPEDAASTPTVASAGTLAATGGAANGVASAPADEKADKIASISAKISKTLKGLFPAEKIKEFLQGVVSGTLQFLLAILLSFLIVLDFDRVAHELAVWRESPVGRFFHQAAASVVDFSEVVGTAFQCQMIIAVLNASITCIGLAILGIGPLVLLTTIVLLLGLIPVLGVFVSSVPIILIAFNSPGGVHLALMALGMIVIVHLLEAYVFNPRVYAARFHLNPVIVLIILLVAHELFGVWGMLLGIPVTHYVLNVAQMPSYPRKQRGLNKKPAKAVDALTADSL